MSMRRQFPRGRQLYDQIIGLAFMQIDLDKQLPDKNKKSFQREARSWPEAEKIDVLQCAGGIAPVQFGYQSI